MVNTLRFADAARIVGEVARVGALRVPAFRSPPVTPGVDRVVIRRGSAEVVAVRRRGRPAAAIHADLIEGVVVINALEPAEASIFRGQAWSAISALELHRLDSDIVVELGSESAPQSSLDQPSVVESVNRFDGAGDVPEQNGREVPRPLPENSLAVTDVESAVGVDDESDSDPIELSTHSRRCNPIRNGILPRHDEVSAA